MGCGAELSKPLEFNCASYSLSWIALGLIWGLNGGHISCVCCSTSRFLRGQGLDKNLCEHKGIELRRLGEVVRLQLGREPKGSDL